MRATASCPGSVLPRLGSAALWGGPIAGPLTGVRCYRYTSSETVYATKEKSLDEEEIEERLQEEARAAGFKHKPESPMQALFIFLDEPASSIPATIFSLFILVLIVASSFSFLADSHPVVRCDTEEFCAEWETTVEDAKAWQDMFHLIEYVAIIVFTIEYVLRIGLCTFRPRKNRSFCKYFMKGLNVVDLLAILPFWVERVVCSPENPCNSGVSVVRLLRLARIFRVLKAGNFAAELQVFVWGYYRAREGLLLLFFLLFLYLCLFAAVSPAHLSALCRSRLTSVVLQLLYMTEYSPQTEACYTDAGYPMCWQDLGVDAVDQFTDGGCEVALTDGGCVQPDDGVDGKVIAWEMRVEQGENCNHCLGNTLYNCVGALANGTERTYGRNMECAGAHELCEECRAKVGALSDGAAVWTNRTEEVLCNQWHPNFIKMTGDDTEEFCMRCKDVQWPGKEPLRCATRAFTSIPTSWYFILATMTTVGYGEHYPAGPMGQIVCSFCMIFGTQPPVNSPCGLARSVVALCRLRPLC